MAANINDHADSTRPAAPEIVRAAIDKLTIYEISDAELLSLERGYPGSILLNFAIFLLSVAVTVSVALLTTTVNSERLFDIFFLVLLVGYLFGFFFAILWARSFLSSPRVSKTIRERLRAEGLPKRVEGTMGIESPPSEQLEILEASYGVPDATLDVTSHVVAMLKDNAVRIVASNRIAGDPAVGKSKKLIIRYRLNQMTYYSEFLEGTEAVIPLRA